MGNVRFMMMVGLPASGKTTLSKIIVKNTPFTIISLDDIRLELYGSEEIQTDHKRVFEIMEYRTLKELKAGNNVIYDATNIYKKNRLKLLEKLADIQCSKECVYIDTGLKRCLFQNRNRKRNVPKDAIKRMNKKIQKPTAKEGWNIIYKV
jgi:predicted kinase